MAHFTMQSMNPPQTLGDRIREQAELRGISINELSRRAEIDRPHLSRILNGQTGDPRISTLIRIAEAIGCTVDDLAPAEPAD